MKTLVFKHSTKQPLSGTRDHALVGVVASGNLEILAERVLEPHHCEVVLVTSVTGFDATWRDVVADFVERTSPGGVRFTIHDGGARPDVVMLRLSQATKLLEHPRNG